MRTWRLLASQWVPGPPAAVFPFFADARNLELLTPPGLSFRILTPLPVDMHEGTLIDYRLRVHGLPIGWRTRINRWQPPIAFVDEQLRGPYSLWHHTHTFTARDGGTVLGDEVVLRPKGGPLARVVMALLVRRDVEQVFRYRAGALVRHLGADPSTATLQWLAAPSAPGAATGGSAGRT